MPLYELNRDDTVSKDPVYCSLLEVLLLDKLS